jgi:hypothetical protein
MSQVINSDEFCRFSSLKYFAKFIKDRSQQFIEPPTIGAMSKKDFEQLEVGIKTNEDMERFKQNYNQYFILTNLLQPIFFFPCNTFDDMFIEQGYGFLFQNEMFGIHSISPCNFTLRAGGKFP